VSRGNTVSQAHPVAPRAQYLRRSDPPPSRLARIARAGAAIAWLFAAGAAGWLVVAAMTASWPRP
jgi:hypothetical protein